MFITLLSLGQLFQGASSFIINQEHGAFLVVISHKPRAGALCNTIAWRTSDTTAPGLTLKLLGAENASHMSGCPQGSGVTLCTDKNQMSLPSWRGQDCRMKTTSPKHHLWTRDFPARTFPLLGPPMHLPNYARGCTAQEDQEPWTCRSLHCILEKRWWFLTRKPLVSKQQSQKS